MEQRFEYHRAVAPTLWLFVALASIELIVVHFLLSFWSRTLAVTLSVLTLGGIAWLIECIVSMRRLPVLLDDQKLLMRVGKLASVTIDRNLIAGLRSSWSAESLKQRNVRNLALMAYPNVVVELRAPLPGRRGVVAIAHRLDDPAAFVRAIETLGEPR